MYIILIHEKYFEQKSVVHLHINKRPNTSCYKRNNTKYQVSLNFQCSDVLVSVGRRSMGDSRREEMFHRDEVQEGRTYRSRSREGSDRGSTRHRGGRDESGAGNRRRRGSGWGKVSRKVRGYQYDIRVR